MSVDFGDPTTWDQPLSEPDALNMAIFALNTLQHPDASTDAQFDALDIFSAGTIEILSRLRERLEAEEFGANVGVGEPPGEAWVVEFVYNTDPEGAPVDEDDWSNRTLHGPFETEEDAHAWAGEQPEDEDVKEELVYKLNDPADRN
jgi:hypothetical protein